MKGFAEEFEKDIFPAEEVYFVLEPIKVSRG
jgi:hypothetical protein